MSNIKLAASQITHANFSFVYSSPMSIFLGNYMLLLLAYSRYTYEAVDIDVDVLL